MNCKQLNAIALEEVLRVLGHLPAKQTEKEAWYLNPFASESQASFKIDLKQNRWYLFSEGVGGNTTDFLQKYFNCSVSDALKWASNHSFFSFHPQEKKEATKPLPSYKIEKICDVQHPNLKAYLAQRGLSQAVYPFVKEVHFSFGSKKLYAIGFENRSGGWELRNRYYKGVLNSHDLSLFSIGYTLPNRNNTSPTQPKVMVFEGFMDALSFIELKKSYQGNLLVLNSIALVGRALKCLSDYTEIGLFLDNDKRGRITKNEILKAFPHAKDYSGIYRHSKDLNVHLMQKKGLAQTPEVGIQKQKTSDSGEQDNTPKKQMAAIKKGAGRRM